VPRVWLAQADEAESVARLMTPFRDHIRLSVPSEADIDLARRR
jgi:hypothetical protein